MKNKIFNSEKIRVEFDMDSGTIPKLMGKNHAKSENLLFSPITPICEKEWKSNYSDIVEENNNRTVIESRYENTAYEMKAKYEIYKAGYIIISFKLRSKNKLQLKEKIKLGIYVDRKLFENFDIDVTNGQDEKDIGKNRSMSVNYTRDEKIAGAIGFAVENTIGTKKLIQKNAKYIFVGCECDIGEGFSQSNEYENRWFIAFSNVDNSPNKARGQRIYHWYGMYPRYPEKEILEEMGEYGCSVLILHMPVFNHIDGCIPYDETEMKRCLQTAKKLGIKVMFYCQPFLISKKSPEYKKLKSCVNSEGENRWNSLKSTQIVFYEPNEDFDCDELCIRCPEAYEYVKNSIIDFYKKLGFDGLYVDFAWPGMGICSDSSHGHGPGLFNYYDYYRMMRELRQEIGREALMIGHGGSLMVPADFIEAFDGCLTGEGQKELNPAVIGVHSGCAPMLWTMHRRKQREFRSADAMYEIIKEGVTPHIGLGIMGKSILATLDPSHTPMFLSLWQMFRAFPVEEAAFYNHLTEKVLDMDNEEIAYSLYLTPKKELLLILINGGGPLASKSYSVGVNVKLDIEKLSLPVQMKCRRMKGNRYENFRILPEETIQSGVIAVDEIGINEFIGFIITPDGKTDRLSKLEQHLKGRFERMAAINENKMKRLLRTDAVISEFNRKDFIQHDEDEFMKDRVVE